MELFGFGSDELMSQGALLGGNPQDAAGLASQSDAFLKATVGGGPTDSALLTGGAALRKESLEASLISITESEEYLTFWRNTAQSKATAFVDEYSRQTDLGGFFEGGGAQGELDSIVEATGSYNRETEAVKFFADRRIVGAGAEVQARNGLTSAIARETQNGTRRILTTLNWGSYFGRADCSPVEFDGLAIKLENGGFFTDLAGKPVPVDISPILDAEERVYGLGSFGFISDYYCSPLVNGDMNARVAPTHRIAQGSQAQGQVTLGTNIAKLQGAYREIKKNVDPFLIESQAPWVGRLGTKYPALAATAAVLPPSGLAEAAAPDAASNFKADHAGAYIYAIEAAHQDGRSATLVKTGTVAVVAGDAVTLTITPDGASKATHFVVHRSRLNGTGADDDLREMTRVAKAPAGDTVYVDRNTDIPGTSKMFLVDNREENVCYRRLTPLTRWPLFPSTQAVHTWAQIFFLYLRVAVPERCHMLKNVLPTGAKWRPFN